MSAFCFKDVACPLFTTLKSMTRGKNNERLHGLLNRYQSEMFGLTTTDHGTNKLFISNGSSIQKNEHYQIASNNYPLRCNRPYMTSIYIVLAVATQVILSDQFLNKLKYV